MLTAEQIDKITDSSAVLKSLQAVEMDILEDMAKRVVKMDFATGIAKWQMQKLAEVGAQRSYIYRELSAITGKSQQDLFRMFNEAATATLAVDDEIYTEQGLQPTPLMDSPQLQQILQAGMQQTADAFTNLTAQTAINGANQFSNVLDRAYMQVTSGAFTYDTAIKNAIKTLASDGVTSVVYPSGRKDNIDVASRRALLTGVNQSALKVSMGRAEQMGVKLVETSAHSGAREDHAKWQGKLFQLKGFSFKYPNFYTATGYGTVTGLGGANCRHSFYPYFKGSKPSYTRRELAETNKAKVTYNGKEIPEAEALQIQRYLERATRRWKREEATMRGAGLSTAQAKSRVSDYQAKLRDFTKQTGLKRDYTRERVY